MPNYNSINNYQLLDLKKVLQETGDVEASLALRFTLPTRFLHAVFRVYCYDPLFSIFHRGFIRCHYLLPGTERQ